MSSKSMIKVAAGLLLVGVLAFSAQAAIPYQGYRYGTDITFGGYTGSEVLTNYPALVKISTSTVANFSYANMLSDSADLRFVDPSDTSALNYEIDTWNTNGDSYVWVQIPKLTNNATIRMYWGKASDTAPVYTTNGASWAEGFVGNWHMNERNVKDSTVYARNGSSAPVTVTNAVGLIGTAQGYQANGGTALTGNILLTNQTLSSWVWCADANRDGSILAHQGDDVWYWQQGTVLRFETVPWGGDTTCQLTAAGGAGTWIHFVATVNGTTQALYTNGALYASWTKVAPAPWGTVWWIGGLGGRQWKGLLDEVSMAKVARSASWVKACYQNQKTPTVFATYSAATVTESIQFAYPTVSAIDTTNATINATVESNQSGNPLASWGTAWGTTAATPNNMLEITGSSAAPFSFSQTRYEFTAGQHVYARAWASNAVDGLVFSVPPATEFYTEPEAATGLSITDVAGVSFKASWTAGTGSAGTLVIVAPASVATNWPSDGTVYTANALFGSGANLGNSNYVVYAGAGNNVVISNLLPLTTYRVAVVSYSGSGTLINYQADQAPVTEQATSSGPPLLALPTATIITSSNAILGATVMTDGGSVLLDRGTVWGTAPSPVGNSLSEGGTTLGIFSHLRTGLTAGQHCYYRGWATTALGTGYSTDGEFYVEPEPATAVSFSGVNLFSCSVTWTPGTGSSGSLVVIRQGAAPAAPVDGTTYTANAWFGSGSDLGSGSYVVYTGSGSSALIGRLSKQTSYQVAVYSYSGSGSLINYQQVNPVVGTLSTITDALAVAGEMLVDVHAMRGISTNATGSVTNWINYGSLCGVFTNGAAVTYPLSAQVANRRCISFDGGDWLLSSVTMPTSATTNKASYSVEFWANDPSRVVDRETAVAWARRGDAAVAQFGPGNLAAEHWGNYLYWSPYPSFGNWHHFVITYDGTTERGYLDGVANSSGTKTLDMADNNPISLGAAYLSDMTTPQDPLSGGIVAVRIHTGVLTPTQVSTNYGLGLNYIVGGPLAVQAYAATSVSHTSAMLNGTLTKVTTTADVTFYCGTTDAGMNKNAWTVNYPLGPLPAGAFSSSASVVGNTTYYYRACASNAEAEVWSDLVSFTTPGLASITNLSTAVASPTLAYGMGYLYSTNQYPTTIRMYWGTQDRTNDAANWAASTNIGIKGVGTVMAKASNLLPGTTYYFRFSGSNAAGESFSPVVTSFTTPSLFNDSRYDYKATVQFAGYTNTENLAGFPALVVIWTNLINGFQYSQLQPSLADLRFVGPDKGELAYEVEKWDTNGTSYVWVQVPEMVKDTTAITMYWKNAWATVPAYTTNGAPWAAGFVGVWHLTNTLSRNSTALANYNVNSYWGTAPNPTAGRIGDGLNFPGGAGLNAGDVDLPETFSLSLWINQSNISGDRWNIRKGGANYSLMDRYSNWEFNLNYWNFNNNNWATTPATQGVWEHITGTYDGAAIRLYKNGVLMSTKQTTGMFQNDSQMVIGDSVLGVLDEVRAERVTRSAAWVQACYTNQISPATFATYGALAPVPRMGTMVRIF
jgi:hypothetical protein